MKEQLLSVLTPVFADPAHPVHESAFVNPDDIPFSAAVRAMCADNRCGHYGKSWSCPPGVGEWEVLRNEAQSAAAALVYATCHVLEDSFDIEGMTEAAQAHCVLDDCVTAVLCEHGIAHTLLGAGVCNLCKECTYPDAPCRFPDRMRRPMEGCGIDVVSLSRKVGVKYNNGPDTVTYFSLLLLY